MENPSTQADRQEHHRLITWLHAALPEEPDPTSAALDGLPPVNWASVGVTDWQKPKPVTPERSKKD